MSIKKKYYKNFLPRFVVHYNRQALIEKLRETGKKAGMKIVYLVLLLYYASFDKELPVKDRVMVIGALGYFIVPADLIPDVLPLGFADDAAALMFVLRHVWSNLTPATKEKARNRISEWFGTDSPNELTINDL